MKNSDSMFTILMMYTIGSLVLSALSIPLILRKIKPNHFYGFRVPATLSNPALWYDVNAYAGKRLFITGIVCLLSAIVFYFIPGLSLDGYAYLCLAVMIIAFAVTMIQSFLFLKANRQDH